MALPKVEIKKILFATDLSPSASYAFSYAVSLADHYCASITLLHVLHQPPGFVESIIGADKLKEIKHQHYEGARETLVGKRKDHVIVKEILDRFCENVRSDRNLPDEETDDVLITEGNPVDEILRTAEERNCDVIVMGTHGVRGITDAMIGSTAKLVLRRSRKPVFVVRLPEETE